MAQLSDEFHEIRSGTSDEFKGQTACAFRTTLESVATKIHDVPKITDKVSLIFSIHKDRLDSIQKEADAALARAQTHWNERNDATSDKIEYGRQLRIIDEQLACVTDPDSESSLLSSRSYTVQCLSDAESRRSKAEDALDESRREWDSLRGRECDLNEQTAQALRSVELWSLADPGWWEKVVSWVKEGVFGFLELLHELCDWIDDKLFWIAVGVLAVALILAVVVSGGAALALLAAVIPILVKAAMATAVVKASSTVIRKLGGDEDVTWSDVGWDLGGVGLAFLGGPAAKGLGRGVSKVAPSVTRMAGTGTKQIVRSADRLARKPYSHSHMQEMYRIYSVGRGRTARAIYQNVTNRIPRRHPLPDKVRRVKIRDKTLDERWQRNVRDVRFKPGIGDSSRLLDQGDLGLKSSVMILQRDSGSAVSSATYDRVSRKIDPNVVELHQPVLVPCQLEN